MTQTIHAAEHLDSDTLCAFIDDELATMNQQKIQVHLTNCHPCALRALSVSQLKTAIAQVGLRLIPDALDPSEGSQNSKNDLSQSDPQRGLFVALTQIQPPFREPLLLSDVAAVKYHDIGAILDIPVDTAVSRISTARDAIRQILQQQSGELQ